MALTHSYEAARRLAAIVSSSDDAIVSKDLNGVVQSWNAAAERLFGYTEAEMIGQPIRRIIPADRQHEEDHVLRQIRSGARVHHFETIRQRKDGSLFPVSLTISPIFAEDGTIVGASKIARDITERRRAEAELLRLESERADLQRRLLALVAASQEVVGRIETREVMEATLSLARDLVGADAYVIWRRHADTGWVLEAESGLSASFEHVVPSLPHMELLLAAPLIVPDLLTDDRVAARREALAREGIASMLVIPLRMSGEASGTLVFYYRRRHDFSDVEVQTASALGSLAAAGIRTAELYEHERQAQEDARQANLIKDQFLATLSHELRTPLNAILGYTRMLLNGTIPPERQQRGLEVISRNGTALAQIVEDVLDVSRIVTGKLGVKLAPLDLAPLVQHATETVLPMAADKAVHVSTVVPEAPVPIQGDANRLQQVVWNLVTNAVKFTPPDGTVTVALAASDQTARLTVTDTGAGIPSAFLTLIFEPFRQADTRPTREVGGLGLGLAITRRLVELHGGTISATSDGEGKGSCFEVLLPLGG
ncbi:MAG: PAS domain S-box protein [Vicinamibacterales bacterium]